MTTPVWGVVMMILLVLFTLLSSVAECVFVAATTSATTLEEWTRDSVGMYIATSFDEQRAIAQLAFWQQQQYRHSNRRNDQENQATSSPFSMTLTWVEDSECIVKQNDEVIQSIHSAVSELLTMTNHQYHHRPPIPTIRWTLSSNVNRLVDVKFLLSGDITATPSLLITTQNATASYTVEYSGRYYYHDDDDDDDDHHHQHIIAATVHHYYDWLTIWSTSIYHPNSPSISLTESKPKTFRTKQDMFDYWEDHHPPHPVSSSASTTTTTTSSTTSTSGNPLLLVYYHQALSLCQNDMDDTAASSNAALAWNATLVQEEMKVFDLFAITVAGRRDRFFFYGYDCRPQLHVYEVDIVSSTGQEKAATLLYQWDRSSSNGSSLHSFLVQASSDALVVFHRERTYPIAMAHDIQIVALAGNVVLDEEKCREWKRRYPQLICLVVEPHEYRLIASLRSGLPLSDRVVIVDAERHVHVQPVGIDIDPFVEATVFTTTRTTESLKKKKNQLEEPTPKRQKNGHSIGGIQWIEDKASVFPQHGIVLAVSRTCGHCQRLLAILTRLEGLLHELHWTDDFPLYVIDVTKTDMIAQPLWLPTVYYNGVQSLKRTYSDETEILEWVFSQMLEEEVVALQNRL
jgi:hypothetical protein